MGCKDNNEINRPGLRAQCSVLREEKAERREQRGESREVEGKVGKSYSRTATVWVRISFIHL
jgi:hypothetical protein